MPVAPGVSTFCTQGSLGYESLRTGYFNAKLPPDQPLEIATPTTTAQVCEIIQRAAVRGLKVGVRSGGHLFPACSLIDGGVLIDTRDLNRDVEYDASTSLVSFGPALTVREAQRSLTTLHRFFPFGHHPSVGLGGFLLAGGQGWFMRAHGYTTDAWVEQLEVVMPDGQSRVASRDENADIFWAARGSGQGFFGVVTKIWTRTVPSKRIYDRTLVLRVTHQFEKQLTSVMKTCDLLPKGVDIALVSHWSDILDAADHLETRTGAIMLSVALTAHANSLEESRDMLAPFDSQAARADLNMETEIPLKETSWDAMWDMQDALFLPGRRWQVDSILTDKDVSYAELARLSKRALCELPTRKSVGTICIADYYPNEADQALSLQQHHYVSTMTSWADEAEDGRMQRWMFDAYTPLEKVSVGQYIADFNAAHRTRKVMTTSAMDKWLRVREAWDPKEMFIGHRGFTNPMDQGRITKI